eukprot:m.832104 g.832104  ORF g.832104 m.832104 type:complete len:786 (+) comp59457_c0_seq5:31-2388(+)
MAGDSALITSVIVNGAVAAIILLLVRLLFYRKPTVYTSRTKHPAAPHLGVPAEPNKSFFEFVKGIYTISERDCLDATGLDAILFIRFLKFGIQVFVYATFAGWLILIPIHATDDFLEASYNSSDSAQIEPSGIDKLSMSNISTSSSRLWAHTVCTYAFTAVVMYLLVGVLSDYQRYRAWHFEKPEVHQRSIVIFGIPMEYWNKSALTEKLGSLFQGIQSVSLVQNTADLPKIFANRAATLIKVEKAHYSYLANQEKAAQKAIKKRAKLSEGRRESQAQMLSSNEVAAEARRNVDPPQTRDGGFLCCGGQKVPAFEFFEKHLVEENSIVRTKQDEFESNPKAFGVAFVTFQTLKQAAYAQQCVVSGLPHLWETHGAVEPRNVLWTNLSLSTLVLSIRHWAALAIVFFLIFFFMIPIAFVQSLTNLEALGERVPFMKTIADSSPVVKSIIEGYLPTLILIIFLAILPMILMALTKLQGVWSNSAVIFGAAGKMMLFQVVNVFFASIISGSIFSSLNDVLNEPTSAASLLGKAIPNSGVFFINFVMIKTFSALPIQALLIGPLIVAPILRKFLATTPRDFKNLQAPPMLNYIASLSGMILVLIAGFVYAIVAPVITIFCLAFFGLAHFIFKYQCMYVYAPPFESGGSYISTLLGWTVSCLFLAQLTIVGVIGVKQGAVPAALLFPLLVITIFFYLYCTNNFDLSSATVPLSDLVAQQADESDDADEDAFLQPELQRGDLSLAASIAEFERPKSAPSSPAPVRTQPQQSEPPKQPQQPQRDAELIEMQF